MATLFRRAQPKQEDLGEALGQISLYNEALGTVSTFYLNDRCATGIRAYRNGPGSNGKASKPAPAGTTRRFLVQYSSHRCGGATFDPGDEK